MADYFEEMGWQPLGPGETPNHLLDLARLLRDFGMWEELGEDKKLPPPTSKEVLSNLEEKEISVSGSQCPICLKEYNVGEMVKVLPCKHNFHCSCILPWLEKTSTCPLCRHELTTDDEDYENYKKEKCNRPWAGFIGHCLMLTDKLRCAETKRKLYWGFKNKSKK